MVARTIHAADYAVFAAMLLGTLSIGVYHAFRSRRKSTTAEYLVGGRRVNTVAVSISLMVSYIAATLILGIPAEVYNFGSGYWFTALGTGIGALLAVVMCIPVLYPLKLTSINQYLQMRYNSRLLVVLGSLSSAGVMILYTGTVYYSPAVAIEAVTGFPVWASILIGSALTILYTTIGGFKAVIWSDVFQATIMVCGFVAMMIKGTIEAGGIDNLWSVAGKWGRLNFINLNPDPRERYSLWVTTIGVGYNYVIIYGYTQTAVQRYSSFSMYVSIFSCVLGVLPGATLMSILACMTGLFIFVFYALAGCDPLKRGIITSANQIVPHFLLDVLNYPGLPGLFISSLAAASLSSASSALNSAAANVWCDILQPIWPNLPETRNLLITKSLVVGFGIMATLAAYAVSFLGGTVIQVIATFSMCAGGPTGALFLMGQTFPFVNWQGALTGGVLSFAFGLWVAFGSYTIKGHDKVLSSPTENCTAYAAKYLPNLVLPTQNMTTTSLSPLVEAATKEPMPEGLDGLYSISYLWIGLFTTMIAVIIGVIVSILTGGLKQRVDPVLLHPFIRRCVQGCGVKVDTEKMIEDKDCGTISKEGDINDSKKIEKELIICQTHL